MFVYLGASSCTKKILSAVDIRLELFRPKTKQDRLDSALLLLYLNMHNFFYMRCAKKNANQTIITDNHQTLKNFSIVSAVKRKKIMNNFRKLSRCLHLSNVINGRDSVWNFLVPYKKEIYCVDSLFSWLDVLIATMF